MPEGDDGSGEPWPDREELRRWELAMADVQRRLREERGVDDPSRVTVDSDALWVEYGDLRVVVAGAAPDVLVPEELFEEVDRWVAFDRMDGPGLVLDRDRAAIAEWRRRLPALQLFWQEIARRVFADVEATTNLRLPWNVTVHDDAPDWRPMPRVEGGSGAGELPGRWLAFPEVWLETPHAGRWLPEMADEAEALGRLADLVQDDVIDELYAAWPQCPRHPHPLEVGYTELGRPVCQCPQDSSPHAEVGMLGSGPAAAGPRSADRDAP